MPNVRGNTHGIFQIHCGLGTNHGKNGRTSAITYKRSRVSSGGTPFPYVINVKVCNRVSNALAITQGTAVTRQGIARLKWNWLPGRSCANSTIHDNAPALRFNRAL